MCGFLGAVFFERWKEIYLPALRSGLKSISHRGPDGSHELISGNSYLGHNRLSIIDLSAEADQPMSSCNFDAHIIFNGEIYNYKELKKNLNGINFKTRSDTEVILEGYCKEGTEFFKKLRGIYSFCILDNRTEQKIILCRDQAGVKPLYYYSDKNFSVFGSEIKALLPLVRDKISSNEKMIRCYLNLGYCPEPYTVYNEIKTVAPGHITEISEKGMNSYSFSEYKFGNENNYSLRKNTELTEEKLKNAVKRNLVSDVEVAVALSGGIDSSLVYAYSNENNKNIKGLTVRFDDKEYNEEEIALKYVESVSGKHESVEVSAGLNLETLDMILNDFDQPYADSSAVNVYFLTKATGNITKVLVGGDGGDELFNGYPSQTWLTYVEKIISSSLIRNSGKSLVKIINSVSGSSGTRLSKRLSDLLNDRPEELLYDWHSWFPRKTIFEGKSPFMFDTEEGLDLYNSIFREEVPGKFRHKVVFDYFRKTMLSDYLRKTDMMSMLNGVEYRVPMLDEDLSEFALGIPFAQKSSLRKTKIILRKLHSKIYPPETSRIPKRGFMIPLDKALKRDEFEIIKESILKNESIVLNYISKDYIEFLFKALRKDFNAGDQISRAGVYQRILMFYSLNLWDKNK
ncbi:MAG: asparagine synthase (glutamine-hydrolyzing) [Bacteroidetes bacterium]|nr:asparagine synthase (glutamine-hydrolyzing) [Bacteroidota bacterium]